MEVGHEDPCRSPSRPVGGGTPASTRAKPGPRVWFLTESFFPPFVGGLEKYAYVLSSRLVAKGLDMRVITRKQEPQSPARELFGNVLINRIPPVGILKGKGWRAVGPLVFLLGRVTWLLVKNARRYDVLLVSGVRILSIPAVLVSRMFRKKCIVKSESPIELQEVVSTTSLQKMNMSRTAISLKLWRSFRDAILRRADCQIATGVEIRRQLLGIGVSPHKIQTIPNGVDTERFAPVTPVERLELRRRLSLPVERTLFVFVGRLATTKGVMMLARAWKELARERPGIHLVYVGSGQRSVDSCEAELIEFLRDNRLERSVTLAGEVDEVARYLQAADVFVLPSDYEGFSIALIEALATGLPAIATCVGAAPELIRDGENGLLVNPKDLPGLQRAMEWMLDHRDLWRAMGDSARRRVLEECSIDAVADRYLQLFDRLRVNDRRLTAMLMAGVLRLCPELQELLQSVSGVAGA